MQPRSPLDNFVANELSRRAPVLAEEWIGHIERADREAMATEALIADLRHHIPDLVHGVVEFMRDPTERSRSALVTRLRQHADRRRARGYDIHQLLTDFELLSKLVFASFADAVERYDGGSAQPREVAALAGRLREALMEITSDAVGMYRQAELEQRRALARKLADYARVITHELKNPLSAAQSGTQMLQEADLLKTADDRDRFIRLVLRNLVRMQDLMHDIRAVALADDGDREERWLPLDALVAKVFDELRHQAVGKGVHLEIGSDLPGASVDASRLDIVLSNLIGNAIKYSDARKERRRVTVSTGATEDRRKSDRLRIEIRDNGLGIPQDRHGSVFKQGFRAHQDVAEGTGLGLAIASELVADAGGRIWFESEEGTGTTFFIELPAGEDRRVQERRGAEVGSSLRDSTRAATGPHERHPARSASPG